MKRPAVISLPPPSRDEESAASTRPLSLSLIRRLFAYTRPYTSRRNLLLLLVIIRAVQLPLLAWAVGAVVNGPIADHDPAGILWGTAGFLGLVIATGLVMRYRMMLAMALGESVIHDLRNDLFRHLLRMPMSFFDQTRVGRIISRFTSDAEAVRVGVQDVLFVSLVQGGQMLVAAGMLCWYDRPMFALVMLMTPIMWLLNRHFRHRLSRGYRLIQESFSRVTAAVAESVRGVREVQGYARQDVNTEMFRQLALDHSQYNVGIARATGVFFPLLELNSQTFISALVLLGGYRVLHPETGMTLGDFIQFFLLANFFFSPIQSLAGQYNNALTAMAGAERVFRFLDTPPAWTDPPDAVTPASIEGRVEFDHVSFQYGPDRPALRDVSFRVEPGQTVALVGPTGSGKTTIIRLLAKFYLPTEGTVRLDGRDLRTIRSDWLHQRMGIVLQENFLFTGTVLDNIRVGCPEASEEEARDALRRMDCLDLLDTLPEGLMTRVGERGVGLSLGQRQLICFARAMVANPVLLILDEATSSVDPASEARIQRAMRHLLRHRTSFIVAHRLSTVLHADLALVMEHGRLVELGNHATLLAANGIYARLYRHFASGEKSLLPPPGQAPRK